MSYKDELLLAIDKGDLNTISAHIHEHTNGYRKSFALRKAARDGQVDVVKYLLQVGADSNDRDPTGRTVMYHALQQGHYDVSDCLIHYGAKVDNKSIALLSKRSPNDYDMMRHMLVHGEMAPRDPEMTATLKELMMKAFERKDLEFACVLIEKHHMRVNNTHQESGHSPLISAILKSDRHVIKYLVNKGADVNYVSRDHTTSTPLEAAIQRGDVRIVKYLVVKGANVNRVNPDGKTYIDLAKEYGSRHGIVKFLRDCTDMAEGNNQKRRRDTQMDRENNNSSSDGQGSSGNQSRRGVRNNKVSVTDDLIDALHQSQSGSTMSSTLSESGTSRSTNYSSAFTSTVSPASITLIPQSAGGHACSPPPTVHEKLTPITGQPDEELLVAAGRGDLTYLQRLIEGGNDVGYVNHHGYTALHEASSAGHLDIVKYLVGYGAYVNAFTQNGDTSLTLAVEGGHSDVVRYLLKLGADTDQINSEGYTALELASGKGDAIMVKCLLESGADVNISPLNNEEDSALHCGVMSKQFEVVQLLVESGADTSAENVNNETPLNVALGTGNREIIDYLMEHFKPSGRPRLVRRTTTLRTEQSLETMDYTGGDNTGGVITVQPLPEPRNSADVGNIYGDDDEDDRPGYRGRWGVDGQGKGKQPPGCCMRTMRKFADCFCESVRCFLGVHP